MIIGIGSDIVEHEVTEKLKWASDLKLLTRIFSSKEIELYQTHPVVKFLSSRFAVKEAVLKCLGIGMDEGIALPEIETLSDLNSKPLLKLTGETKCIADEMNIEIWHVSITHTSKQSLAFVIAEGFKV